jgi:uncharacterized membrane protein YdjX (TVP38/TMEM64 family)
MNKKILNKITLLAIIIGLVAAVKLFHLDDYLTLSYIKTSQRRFEMLYAQRPFPVIASYAAIYILVTSLSLPGAAVMTLAGGALFGLYTGTVVVSFASSIGATLACFVSRYLLRDWVQKRFGGKLTAVTRGIEQEGAFYLFTLRLIPIFPFWLINLLMGLTNMPLRTFYWVSQTGMLAATIVYVNAGTELSKIDSLSGILSPRLILSFTALGIFPFAAKKLAGFYKSGKKSAHR